jgi:AraC family transcriptional regulator, regulatory protein of adaptative response / DNA-3-methyladenine glycosylase II
MEDLDHDPCYRALQTRDARFDGRIFVGVRTTGIYCRPICPARTPKSQNVTFYPSAAAAQAAGLRPCLRCRPETSPDLAAWRGTSNTVARALRLIEAGAMDEGDVDRLAERLGVGERQLRRLFRKHLGASPVAVAQTRRVLLAKQLIHETRLPMGEVALAAGFGSVRRFNETFQQLYQRPPRELRRLGGADAPAGVAGASVTLAYRPPYDWEAMIGFLAQRAILGVETVAPRRYARALRVGTATGVVIVEPGAGDYLRVTLKFPDLTAWPAVIARVRRVFDLAVDPAALAGHLSHDPLLAELIAQRPGLRAPGAWDGFELAVRAVLGQQITVSAARLLGGKLTAAFGEALPQELRVEGVSRLFPTPRALMDADIASAAGMPASRAAALRGLAKAATEDPLLFAPRGDLAQAVARLRDLPGIGEWTAQYVALRELREPDAFPHGDIGLMRAIEKLEGRRPSAAELNTRAEAWRPWRAYAATHLWTADAAHPNATSKKDQKHDRRAA